MNNLALKFSKESFLNSVRVQQLMDEKLFPDEEFENQEKKVLYEKSKYFHKAQHGLVRISKYFFPESADTQRKCLSKHGVKLSFCEHGYDYGMADLEGPLAKQSSDTKIWQMNFASEKAFTEWGSEARSQEAAMIMEMPLLHKASLFLDKSGITDSSLLHKNGASTILTPILFEGVPQWVSLCNGQMKMITWDKTSNVISMMAPYGGDGLYKEKEIIFMLLTLFAGFGGIKRRGIKDKVPFTEIHTGNWGCGNMRNHRELIYLAQIYVADVLGIESLVFYMPDNQLMNDAIEKWKAIPDNLCFEEAVKVFTDYGFRWR